MRAFSVIDFPVPGTLEDDGIDLIHFLISYDGHPGEELDDVSFVFIEEVFKPVTMDLQWHVMMDLSLS